MMDFINFIQDIRQKRKNNNFLRILGSIWRKNGISRHMLAQELNMTKVSMSKNIEQLIALGFVEEALPSGSGCGRKPIPLHLKHELFYTIGVNLYSAEELVLMDAQSQVVASCNLEKQVYANWREKCDAVIKQIERLLSENGITFAQILGIGVSLPGIIDPPTGDVLYSSSFRGALEFNLYDYFKEKTGKAAVIMNTAHLIPIIEKKWGAAQDMNSFLCFHDGFGLGMVLDGHLYRGHQFHAGEAGFVQMQPEGPADVDGRCGTIGALVPFYKITDRIEELIKNNGNTLVRKYLREHSTQVKMKMVVKAVRDGDRLCAQLVSETFEVIGRLILNLAYLFNPEAIFVADWTAECPEVTTEVIERIMGHYGVHNWRLSTKIISAKTNNKDFARGAALLPALKMFNDPIL